MLISSSQAHADTEGPRTGFFAQGAFGLGYASGAYHYEALSNPGYGVPVQPLEFDVRAGGLALDLSGALGGFVLPGLAIAGDVGAQAQSLSHEGDLGATAVEGFGLWRVGALVHFDPGEAGRFYFQLGGGWASGGFASSQTDIGSPDNVVEPEDVSGPMGHLGVGYAYPTGLGMLARAYVGRMWADDSRFTPLALVACVTVGFL